MENVKLGRAVLDQIDGEPASFDMATWGIAWGGLGSGPECGMVACLGGWTMLKAGYRLDSDGDFLRPDGTPIPEKAMALEAEKLLGMPRAERLSGATPHVHPEIWFDLVSGLERFRALVEQAEKAEASHWSTRAEEAADFVKPHYGEKL